MSSYLRYITYEIQRHGEKSSLRLSLFLRTIWIVGVCQALIGFAQYFALFGWMPIGTGKTAMIGFIGAANGYGTLMALSTMAVVLELIEARSTRLRIVLIICGALILAALLFNGSRGALLALVAAIIVFLIARKRKWSVLRRRHQEEIDSGKMVMKGAVYPIVASVVVIILLFGGLAAYLYRMDTESSLGRIFVWRVSAPMFLEHPVSGIGVGKYPLEYLDYQARFFNDPKNLSLAYKASNMKQALSEYVQTLCESGIIGELLFLSVIGSALWFYFSSAKRDSLIIGAGSLLIVILVHIAVDTPLHIIPISVIMACLLGFSPVPAKWEWQLQIKSRSLVMVALCILLVGAGFIGIESERYYDGHLHWLKGYELNTEHRWQFAIPEYEKALTDLPKEGELLFHLGAAQVLTGSYSKGVYHLQQARQWYNDRNMYLCLSQGYLGLGQYADAKKYALIALSMFPDQLAPHLLLGQIYHEMGDIKDSKESLRKCIRGDTSIRSDEVEQIGSDAENLWREYYGSGTNGPIFQ
jgi:O-antigen polymerase